MGDDSLADEDLVTTTGVDTSPDVLDRWFRWVLVVALAALVTATLLGWLGVTTGQVAAAGDRLRLQVRYAEVSRGGLATPFEITVATLDGSALPGSLDVMVTSDYLAMFDENGLDPAPAESWSDERDVIWTFHPPDGADSLTVSFDARLEPAVQRGSDGRVVVETEGERVEVAFRTAVMP